MTTRLYAVVARRAQYSQRPFARGHDEIVLMGGTARREGRGHVQHILIAVNGLLPTLIPLQIGGSEGEAGFRPDFLEHLTDVGGALQAAHRRTHAMTRREQAENAVAAR